MTTNRLTFKGFTLIELLVSVAIFSIVMVMALGALLSLSVATRKAETLKSAIDNLTFGLDSMSRAMRTGSNYHCLSTNTLTAPQDCPNGGNFITFLASGGLQTYYRLDTAQDASSQCGQTVLPYGCIERSTDGGSTWLPITSPDVVVQNAGFLFHVIGSQPTGSGNLIQPKVIITVSGSVVVSTSQTTNFHMQTSVTQRIYDQ